MTFSYEDYLALILIYTANASDGVSQEEYDYIVNKVGGDHFDKAFAYFETANEVEVIEKIDELSNDYDARENREKIFSDVQNMISVDSNDKNIEEQILRMLKHII